MKKVLDWYSGSTFAISSTILLVIFLIVGSAAYGVTTLKCNNYAKGKGQEYSVYFPNQCWIVVDGKNYTKQEYAYKFEGIKIVD